MRSRYKKLTVDGRTVLEHRHVMELAIGRPLSRAEVVHHKSEDRYDNRLENLQVMSHQEHAAHHNQKHPLAKTCPVCGSSFVPAPTKRQRKVTCSRTCFRAWAQTHTGGVKLTREAAEEIRARYLAGETNKTRLAEAYGVSRSTISLIVRGRVWSAQAQTPLGATASDVVP
jgi:hypothetical protein